MRNVECVEEEWDHRSSPSTYLPCPASMLTFEIAVGPSIAKNLRTYQTPKVDRRQTEDLATTVLSESITHDWKGRKMPLEWSNEEDFCVWLASKESEHGIEFVVSNTPHSELLLWQERHILKCAHEWTGGWYRISSKLRGRTQRFRRERSHERRWAAGAG